MSAHRPVTAEYLRAAGRHAGGAARWSSTVKTPICSTMPSRICVEIPVVCGSRPRMLMPWQRLMHFPSFKTGNDEYDGGAKRGRQLLRLASYSLHASCIN